MSSIMEQHESWERFECGLKSAASCCRELAVMIDAQEWRDLSWQLTKMLEKGRRIYKGRALTEMQVLGLVAEMEMAQKAARQLPVH